MAISNNITANMKSEYLNSDDGSGSTFLSSYIKTSVKKEKDDKMIYKYLLPTHAEVHATITKNTEKDNATLKVWVEDDDIKDNDFIDRFNMTISIDKECFDVDETSIIHSEDILTVVLKRSEHCTPKKLSVK